MSEPALSDADLRADPITMFSEWFAAAAEAGVVEPEAAALATADADAVPAVRFVLLKLWDADGFVFFTNGDSVKAADLRANPVAALALRWARLDRQVRITGPVMPVAAATSDRYFASRARRSKLGAWASAQSRPLGSRAELEAAMAGAEGRFAGTEVPRPPQWSGWRVRAEEVEFWQGRRDRLHDRFVYRRAGAGWTTTRLSP